jgi:hypothetical protein
MELIAVQVSFKFILSNKLYFINDQFKLLFFLNQVYHLINRIPVIPKVHSRTIALIA